MPQVQWLENQSWLSFTPPPERDVQKLLPRFWSGAAAEAERTYRQQFLQRSSGRDLLLA